MLYVKARVIAALLGRRDTDQVRLDCAYFGWRTYTRTGSNGKYFSLPDCEATMRCKFSKEQIAAAIEAADDPAAVTLDDNEGVTADGTV